MKLRLLVVTFVAALLTTLASPTLNVAAQDTKRSDNPFNKIPISGPATWTQNGTTQSGTFSGEAHIQKFVVEGDKLYGVTKVRGELRAADGSLVQTIKNERGKWLVENMTTRAAAKAAGIDQVGCDILTLDLGPLNLDLLGLVVDLSAINLDITAVPGAGNLLGNLLCAIAGLLDPGGLLTGLLQQIAGLLNQIIGILG